MNDAEQSLLDMVRASPDELSLREIYADWLEERGDDRADVLRLHAMLRGLAPGDDPDNVVQLRKRLRSLIANAEPVPNVRQWLEQVGIHTTVMERVPDASLLAQHQVVACRLYANWSGPCKMYAKTYRAVAEQLSPWCLFCEFEVDVEATSDGAAAILADVKAIPLVKLYCRGEPQTPMIGVQSLETLFQRIIDTCLECRAE